MNVSSSLTGDLATPLTQQIPDLDLQPWSQLSAETQQIFTRAVQPGTAIDCVVKPRTEAELSAIVTCAAQHQWRILSLGSGSKLDWGNPVTGANLVIDTTHLNRLIDHAVGDLTVTVEAGMTLAQLQQILGQAGQWLPLDPLYADHTTVGGLIATAGAGSLRHRYGGVRDLLIGVGFVRSDGQIAKAGGRVVKNVAGYDLMKLFTGSYGTLGIISQATFRVYPLPEAAQTVVLTGAAPEIAAVMRLLLSSALTPSAVDVLSAPTVKALQLGDGMGLVVRFQSLVPSIQEQSQRLIDWGGAVNLSHQVYSGNEEATLWQQLRTQMEGRTLENSVTCKIGVLPSQAIALLTQIIQQFPDHDCAVIHAGSGLGILQLSNTVSATALTQLRQQLQQHQGFLSVLRAPLSLKQQLDPWGYSGNALSLMRGIKQQFDPQQLLSPNRFVGGI